MSFFPPHCSQGVSVAIPAAKAGGAPLKIPSAAGGGGGGLRGGVFAVPGATAASACPGEVIISTRMLHPAGGMITGGGKEFTLRHFSWMPRALAVFPRLPAAGASGAAAVRELAQAKCRVRLMVRISPSVAPSAAAATPAAGQAVAESYSGGGSGAVLVPLGGEHRISDRGLLMQIATSQGLGLTAQLVVQRVGDNSGGSSQGAAAPAETALGDPVEIRLRSPALMNATAWLASVEPHVTAGGSTEEALALAPAPLRDGESPHWLRFSKRLPRTTRSALLRAQTAWIEAAGKPGGRAALPPGWAVRWTTVQGNGASSKRHAGADLRVQFGKPGEPTESRAVLACDALRYESAPVIVQLVHDAGTASVRRPPLKDGGRAARTAPAVASPACCESVCATLTT